MEHRNIVHVLEVGGESTWAREEFKRIILARCTTKLARQVMANEMARNWRLQKFGPSATARSLTNRHVSLVAGKTTTIRAAQADLGPKLGVA